MKKTFSPVKQLCLLTILALVLSVFAPALADSGASSATQGDAGRSVLFTVRSNGASSITLAQTGKGTMLQSSTWDGSQRYRSLYGMYHIIYSGSYESGSVDMTDETATVSFRYSGTYNVTVQPFTMEEINSVLSTQRSTTDWLYSCVSWSALPAWTVKSSSNCTYQAGGSQISYVTATPAPQTGNRPVLSISSSNAPTQLNQGKTFQLRGYVYTSSGRVTRITGEIYNSAGTCVQSTNVYPYSASYSLESSTTFSSGLHFDQLAPGSYTYKLTATAINGSLSTTNVLVNAGFRVNATVTATPAAQVPVITISGQNAPASLTLGTAFVPKGVIRTSVGNLTTVRGEILDSAGNAVASVTRYPYSSSYDLGSDSTFNNAMTFSKLPSGRYTYRVTATAQNSSRTTTTVLVQSGFFVFAVATATPTPVAQTPVLTVSGEYSPTSLTQGTAFSPRGTFRASCGQITRVTGEILNQSGNVLYTVNRYPYSETFALESDSTFNNSMRFSQLSAGVYTYRVTVTAQNSGKTATNVLINRTFTVYSLATATPTSVTRVPVISVSGQSTPTTFASGTAFNPRGTVRTDCGQLTRVTGEILNQSGSVLYTVSHYPYATSYDLGGDSSFSNALLFSRLTPGSYSYRVTATAQNGGQTTTNIVINSGFYVYAAATATPQPRTPVLSISYPSYPTSYTEGTAFYPRGTVYTDCGQITKVTGEILNASGRTVYSVNRNPKASSYDLGSDSTFSNALLFSRLTPGSYFYQVTATAQNNGKTATATLINASFVVYSKATATPEIAPVLSISGENYPTSYVTGSTFHPRGVIRASVGRVSVVTGEILNSYGEAIMRVDRYPDQQSYDLNNDSTYNYAMKFSQLPAGAYTYRVTATAQNGSRTATQVLIQAGFYVYDNVTQAPVTQAPVTQPPVTQAPVTRPPVTQAPGPSSGDIYIVDFNQPTTVVRGGTFDVYGTVRSDSGEISEVMLEIYNSAGEPIRRVTIHPFRSSMRIQDRSRELTGLRFDLLETGSYTYQVTATAMIGNRAAKKVLVKSTFNVSD